MGAHNSTPQNVRIENPQRGPAMQVTQSVVSRLVGDEDEVSKKVDCTKCKERQQEKYQTFSKNSFDVTQEMQHNRANAQDAFQRKCNEMEEYQFHQSIEKVKTMIGEPLTWVDDVNETILNMRHDLIKCYQEHPKQLLDCGDIAKKYQDFIFRKQYETISKSHEENTNIDMELTPPQEQ